MGDHFEEWPSIPVDREERMARGELEHRKGPTGEGSEVAEDEPGEVGEGCEASVVSIIEVAYAAVDEEGAEEVFVVSVEGGHEREG